MDLHARSDLGPPLRVGIVGSGAVAERYHLPAVTASSEVRVVAFVDPAIDRARRLADRTDAPLVLSSHLELPGQVDLAIVATPNAMHEPIAVDLLNAGVHVLVEKPMARTVAECDRMIVAAEATRALLAVGHDFRHFPIARFARDLFASGLLGTVRRVDVRQSTGSGWPSVVADALTPAAGGGALIAFGVHIVDLLAWWLGELKVVSYRDDAAGGVEAECEAELALAGGAGVHLELSRIRALRDTIVVECDRGTIELGIHEPAMCRLTPAGEATTLVGGVPDPEFERAPMRTVFARQLANVVSAIRNGHRPLVDGAQGKHAVAVIEACYARRVPLRHPWSYPESYASVGRPPLSA